MKKIMLGAFAAISVSAAAPADAALLDYTFNAMFEGGADISGTLTIDDTVGVYTLVDLDLLVGTTTFNTSNASLQNFGTFTAGQFLRIGGNLNGINSILSGTDDFFFSVFANGSALTAGSFTSTTATTSGRSFYASGSAQGGETFVVTPVAGAVPEPTTWMLMLIGMAGVGFSMRRKAKQTVRVLYA